LPAAPRRGKKQGLGRETHGRHHHFVFFITNALLSLLWWAIIISSVLSWLVAFDIINLRNRSSIRSANSWTA
jgi:hypothetical protein